jgi:ABC-2 type transport system permease protein
MRRLNFRLVKELMSKDLQEMRRNAYAFLSMLVLPVVIVGETAFSVYNYIGAGATPAAAAQLRLVLPLTGTLLLMIPAVITVILGSTSVVVEKNNRSLEPLLATPITDSELVLGKALAPFLPAVILSYGAYLAAIVVVDTMTSASLHTFLLPTPAMTFQMLVLAPLIGMLGTTVALLVSTKIKDVRAAQQVSLLAVLPPLLLIASLSSLLGTDTVSRVLMGVAIGLAVVGLGWLTVKRFRRESILISWS